MTQTLTQELLVLDFPKDHEKVTSPEYTLRFGAPQYAECVEVSINGSEWLPTRFSVGFWWYDWSNYMPGNHQIIGRVRMPDGQTFNTPSRKVRVEFPRKK